MAASASENFKTNDLTHRLQTPGFTHLPVPADILPLEAILRLRDKRDPQAVPVLEQALAQDLHTGRIHGFAAAQALFLIGTTEADAALSRQLLTYWPAMRGLSEAPPAWVTGWAIEYSDAWQGGMLEPERSRFIERYLLNNLSTNLVLQLSGEVGVPKGKSAWVYFTFTFKNIGTGPIYIYKPDDWALARMLFFRPSGGRFERPKRPGGGDRGMEIAEVSPGESQEYRLRAYLITTEQYRRQGFTPDPGATIVLGIHVCDYFLTEGEYEFTALYEVDRRSDWRVSSAALSPGARKSQQAWSGRVASDPVRVTLRPQPGPE